MAAEYKGYRGQQAKDAWLNDVRWTTISIGGGCFGGLLGCLLIGGFSFGALIVPLWLLGKLLWLYTVKPKPATPKPAVQVNAKDLIKKGGAR